MTGTTSRDHLFRFWHAFVPRYQAAIELGQTERVARRIARDGLDAYLGRAFEDVCRQWLARRMADGELVCGECKWTSGPVGADVVQTLERRALSVAESPSSTFLLVFSKAGFADSARREADRAGNVQLVDADALLGDCRGTYTNPAP